MSEIDWAALAPEIASGGSVAPATLSARLRRNGHTRTRPGGQLLVQAALDAGWLRLDKNFDIAAGPRLAPPTTDHYTVMEEARAREAKMRGRE